MNKSAMASNKSTPSKLMNRFKKNEQKNQMMSSAPTPTPYPAATSTISFSFEHPSPAESPRDHIPFHGAHDQSSSQFPFSDNRNNGYSPFAGAPTSSAPPAPPPSSSPLESQRIAELEAELQMVQTERDDLMRERKFWLAKIQTDNTKLMHLLQVSHPPRLPLPASSRPSPAPPLLSCPPFCGFFLQLFHSLLCHRM
jgi:hypothetical protein